MLKSKQTTKSVAKQSPKARVDFLQCPRRRFLQNCQSVLKFHSIELKIEFDWNKTEYPFDSCSPKQTLKQILTLTSIIF